MPATHPFLYFVNRLLFH